jgi:ribosome-associated protein
LKAPALATAIAKLTLTKKAANVIIMDLRKVTTMTDFFVVCSADSDTQIRAIANAVVDGTEKSGVSPWHKESGSPNWVLLDYSDVVVHVFHTQARSYYNLEKLWGDAKMKCVTDEKPVPPPRTRKEPSAKTKTKKTTSRLKKSPKRKVA